MAEGVLFDTGIRTLRVWAAWRKCAGGMFLAATSAESVLQGRMTQTKCHGKCGCFLPSVAKRYLQMYNELQPVFDLITQAGEEHMKKNKIIVRQRGVRISKWCEWSSYWFLGIQRHVIWLCWIDLFHRWWSADMGKPVRPPNHKNRKTERKRVLCWNGLLSRWQRIYKAYKVPFCTLVVPKWCPKRRQKAVWADTTLRETLTEVFRTAQSYCEIRYYNLCTDRC